MGSWFVGLRGRDRDVGNVAWFAEWVPRALVLISLQFAALLILRL